MGFENGKVCRVVLRAEKSDGEQVVNTYHYDLDDGDIIDSDNGPQGLADAFRDDVLPGYKALFRDDWTIQPVVVTQEKDPQNPTAPRGQWNSGAAGPGTSASSAPLLPPGSCCVVTLLTSHIGRRFRGRNFYGGWITEDHQDGGVFGSPFLGLIEDFVDTIPVEPDIAFGGSGSSCKWSVYSRTQRAQDLDPYLSPITGHITRTLVHFLRRRALYS